MVRTIVGKRVGSAVAVAIGGGRVGAAVGGTAVVGTVVGGTGDGGTSVSNGVAVCTTTPTVSGISVGAARTDAAAAGATAGGGAGEP